MEALSSGLYMCSVACVYLHFTKKEEEGLGD